MVTNYELKQRARAALKNNWQTALMVALIANLPSLVSQVLAITTQNSMASTIMQHGATVDDLLHLAETTSLTLSTYVPVVGTGLVAWLVSPFLTLGMLNYFFMLLRGEADAPISSVFSRARYFLKGIGLNLMISLRVLLWMLPGFALEAASLFLVLDESMSSIGLVLSMGGLVAMMVLGIRAALHYAMATRVLAECPEKGINQCIRESLAIMRNRKMMLVSLELSFILLYLLVAFAVGIITAMLGNVLGDTLSMVLSFVLDIYVQMAVSAFYLAHRQQATI